MIPQPLPTTFGPKTDYSVTRALTDLHRTITLQATEIQRLQGVVASLQARPMPTIPEVAVAVQAVTTP